MGRIRKRLPGPAMIVAIVALVASMAGTSVAAIGLGALSNEAKDRMVGVGKLTYVGATKTGSGNAIRVEAKCPTGLKLIGGGVHTSDPANSEVEESHPAAQNHWEAVVRAHGNETIEAIAICARSRKVTTVGTPLPPVDAP